ncbi:MAG TPA: hypothetical protein VGN52_16085 [Burkholderiales bacterium]|jgi:hypothetical protein
MPSTMPCLPRPFFRRLLGAAALAVAGGAAAAPPPVHLSTPQEFIGTWKSIPVPLMEQPAESRGHPFLQGTCNYLVHAADGNWSLVTIESIPGDEEKARRCNLTLKEVTEQNALVPDNMRFRWSLQNGMVRMVNGAGAGFNWSAQIADGDGNIALDPHSAGVAMKRGDLVMQMADRSGTKVLWRMVLRKVTR